MPVLGGRTIAQFQAFGHLSHVADAQDRGTTRTQHDGLDLRDVSHLARYAYQELLTITFDVASTGVLVIGLQCLYNVFKRETERAQPCRIRSDVDLALVAAQGIDLGDTGNVAQLRANHPVLQRA